MGDIGDPSGDGIAPNPIGALVMDPLPPGLIAPFARLTEQLGFGELWVPEDYFFNAGIATAAICLGATQRIPVGIGIASAVVRHPAVLAMELATLAGAFPGRLIPGIGLGTPMCLRQMGLEPRSSLAAVRECLTVVRRLLAGEEVTTQGQSFQLDRVRLVHPVPGPIRIFTGAMGPKMLQLCGELADGNIIGVTATPEVVRWSRGQIAEGARRAGRPFDHSCPVFVLYAVAHDRTVARAAIRGTLAFLFSVFPRNAYTEHYGCADELERILARGGPEAVAREMPEAWLDDFAVAGAPDECAERIDRYLEAGATSVIIAPQPADQYASTLELTAREVFPRLRNPIQEGATQS